MRHEAPWIVLGLLLALSPPVAADHEPSRDHGPPLNMELAGAPAIDVFESFASILEAELEFDPAITGLVTIELKDVSLMTSMEAVCEMLGCAFGIDDGPPRRLVVKAGGVTLGEPEPAGDLDTPISMSLRDAPVRVVFESLASIGRWKLALDEATISIELAETPVREVLDQVCVQLGCVWTLDEIGDEGVLRIDWQE